MKFGKYLEARQLELAEYNSHFIDYKALKKLIKQLAIPTLKASSDMDLHLTLDDIDEKIIHQRLQENKAAFFFKLERAGKSKWLLFGERVRFKNKIQYITLKI
ncbi:ASN_collapsed_G0022520.mRNA.1.CDS.1 [Saccharomyces cerevisiae]|nr:ASN_collapsed_G0022520.mRNA.1.CDS.1 [Saccharomyces cerevisiae]